MIIVIVGIIIVAVVFAIVICVAAQIPLVRPLDTLPRVYKTNIDPRDVEIYMVSTSEVGDYATHSIDINRRYAEQWSYRFKVFNTNATPDLPINFGKIQNALDLMNQRGAPKYIVHIDADAVIIKPDYPITAIIDSYMGGYSMLMAEDCYDKTTCSKPGKINSGIFIVKNDMYGRAILARWLAGARGLCAQFVNQFPNCQLVFWNCVMLTHLRSKIRVVPYNLLNGKDGLFIQHMMQHSSNERIEHFKRVNDINHRWDPNTRMNVF